MLYFGVKIHAQVYGMLRHLHRGYNVADTDYDMTVPEFKAAFGDSANHTAMTLMIEHMESRGEKIMSNMPPGEVNVKECGKFVERLQSEGCQRGILVTSGRISNMAKQALHSIAGPAVCVEHFELDELLVDITEHELVPEHQVLNSTEKVELLQRYKLKESQLPRILATDPVARYFGMKHGQVVKITRASETAGRYVTYRIVV